jgi:two-component system, cell cycle sensor histidine kinase and response regulator CckA
MDVDRSRILIVEDEDAHAELLQRAFAANGTHFELVVVRSLSDARRFLADSLPNLIIADYLLPDGAALDLLPSAPEEQRTPLIVLTSHGNEEVAVAAVKRGALDYIVKSPQAFADAPRTAERVLREWRHIIKRRQAEEQLRASEAKYRRLHESMMDAFVAVDMTGRLIEYNDAYVEMLGYPPEELRTLTYPDLTPARCHAEEAEVVATQVLPRGFSDVYTKEYRRKDGTVFPVELRTFLLRNGDGQPAAMWAIVRDITERVRALDDLRKSENLLRAMVTGTTDAVYIKDLAGRYLLFNSAAEAITGKAAVEVIGHDDTFLFPPDEARAVMEGDRRVMESGHAQTYEEVVTHASGEPRTYLSTKGPMLDLDGQVVGLFGIARDITDRKRVEQELQRSEKRFSAVFRHAPAAMTISRLSDGQLVDANDACFQLVGGSLEQAVGRTPRELGWWIRPEVPEQVAAELRANGVVQALEMQARTKAGTIADLLFSSQRIDLDGEPHMLSLAQDITARKRAEAERDRLVAAVEQAAEAFVITDPLGKIEYVNSAFEGITGYSRAEVLGQNPRILNGGQHDKAHYQTLWATITGGAIWKGRFTNRKKDGTLYEEEAVISPVKDASGRIVKFVAVKRDVTRERSLEEQLHQAQKLEAVGQFAAGIAHDFNNLLTALVGYAEVGRDALPVEHAARNALDGITRVADQAAGLTKSLLTFSGRSQTTVEPVQLNRLVTETAKLLQRMLPKIIELRVDVPAETPLWVRADGAQLQQVVMNLVINARDAMPDGGVLNIVVARGRSTPGDHTEPVPGVARLAVRDTGFGMTREVQARIFEPFFTTKSRGRGTGLGLAIVHGIVQEHGGTVEVDSVPGRGSTFTVVLPEIAADAPALHEAACNAMPRGHGELVLFAEDDEYVRALLASELEGLGYVVVTAADGDAALRCYQERRGALRLLVLDFDLPRRTGGECLRLIRQGGDQVPAIIITGAMNPGRLVGQSGAVVLPKPFKIAQLGEVMQRVLQAAPATEGAS